MWRKFNLFLLFYNKSDCFLGLEGAHKSAKTKQPCQVSASAIFDIVRNIQTLYDHNWEHIYNKLHIKIHLRKFLFSGDEHDSHLIAREFMVY